MEEFIPCRLAEQQHDLHTFDYTEIYPGDEASISSDYFGDGTVNEAENYAARVELLNKFELCPKSWDYF